MVTNIYICMFRSIKQNWAYLPFAFEEWSIICFSFCDLSWKNTFYGHKEKWEVFDAMHGWSHNRLEIYSKWCSFVGHTSVTHGLRNEESFLSFPRHLGMLGYTKGYDITYRSTRQISGTFCARFMLGDDCHPLPDQRSFRLIYWGNMNADGLDNDVLLQAKIIKSIQKCLTISGLRYMNNGFCDILIWLFLAKRLYSHSSNFLECPNNVSATDCHYFLFICR